VRAAQASTEEGSRVWGFDFSVSVYRVSVVHCRAPFRLKRPSSVRSEGNLSFTADVIAVPPPPSVSRHTTLPRDEHNTGAGSSSWSSSSSVPQAVVPLGAQEPQPLGQQQQQQRAGDSAVSATTRFRHQVPASVSPTRDLAPPRPFGAGAGGGNNGGSWSALGDIQQTPPGGRVAGAGEGTLSTPSSGMPH